jgi:L-rhamnose-H+ transport protein
MATLIGLTFVLLAGAMVGSAMVPIRFMRTYQFENYWAIYNLMATVLLPWGLAFATVPNLLGVYRQLSLGTLLVPPFFAFAWGIASTLGGMCISRIGLSLTYALMSGIGASAGALVPLVYFSPETLRTKAGKCLLLGVTFMIIGVVIVAKAGREKEKRERAESATQEAKPIPKSFIHGSFAIGLAMTIVGGLLSTGLNFCFAFGQRISAAAVRANASKMNATYAVWAIAMLGGMIPTLAYSLLLCARHKSWKQFARSPITDVSLSVAMGMLFVGSIACYGLGALKLGLLGTSVGWAIMQVTQLAVANLAGFLFGEWKKAGTDVVRMMFIGLTVLTAASGVLAYSNYLQEFG